VLPERVHELIEWELAVAYHQGYQAALADVAARRAELDAAWRPVGRRGYECAVADRIAEMERHADRLRAELDHRHAVRAGDAARDATESGGQNWPPVAAA
jgi:hypothetical protein